MPPDDQAASRPLAGVRVVEAGRMAAGPACATILSDLGAAVVKVEPVDGDPARGPGRLVAEGPKALNPRFELHNRGRRSIAVNVQAEKGRDIVLQLIDRADVFVTNMRPSALNRLALDWETLRGRNRQLVYAQISGYGLSPHTNDRPSYDHGAFWSYAGTAMSFAGAEGEPPQPSGGFGDRASSLALATGIMAALIERSRTGEGTQVSSSLLSTAMWLMGSDVSDVLGAGHVVRSSTRQNALYPTLNSYRCADGRWLWLEMMIPERQWDRLLAALDAPWLDEDERFKGGKQSTLGPHARELISILDGIFATRDLAHWRSVLDRHGVWHAPVHTLEEAVADEIVQNSGAFVDCPGAGGARRAVASPVAFRGRPFPGISATPGVGEHTDSILEELGHSGEAIQTLRQEGIVAGPSERSIEERT